MTDLVRWEFFDPVTLETYQFAINPSAGGSPQYKKTIQYQNTAAPDGKTLIFEGRDEPGTMEVTGTILEQAQYDTFIDWFSRRRQIQVTDDLGRSFNIYITAFESQRQRAVQYPYKHSYTLRYTILDWP